MALSLGVSRGTRIAVGEFMLKVIDIPHTLRVLVHNGQHMFEITDKQRTEVTPGVFLSIGKADRQRPLANPAQARLAFEAPRSIQIVRQE